MKRDERFMRLAIDQCREGIAKGQTPFGACIVRGDEVIANTHNHVWAHTDITAHGEVEAIRAACQKLQAIDLSGCTIYSTCEPCPMCFSAIHWARIERLVYGASIDDAQAAGFHELHISNETMKTLGKSDLIIDGPFMAAECIALFEEWQNSPGARTY